MPLVFFFVAHPNTCHVNHSNGKRSASFIFSLPKISALLRLYYAEVCGKPHTLQNFICHTVMLHHTCYEETINHGKLMAEFHIFVTSPITVMALVSTYQTVTLVVTCEDKCT